MSFSLEQRWEILKTYFQCDCRVAEAVRKLKDKFGPNEAPSATTVRKFVKKVRETGMLVDNRNGPRNGKVGTMDNIAAVAESLRKYPDISDRVRSKELNISRTSLRRIISNLQANNNAGAANQGDSEDEQEHSDTDDVMDYSSETECNTTTSADKEVATVLENVIMDSSGRLNFHSTAGSVSMTPPQEMASVFDSVIMENNVLPNFSNIQGSLPMTPPQELTTVLDNNALLNFNNAQLGSIAMTPPQDVGSVLDNVIIDNNTLLDFNNTTQGSVAMTPPQDEFTYIQIVVMDANTAKDFPNNEVIPCTKQQIVQQVDQIADQRMSLATDKVHTEPNVVMEYPVEANDGAKDFYAAETEPAVQDSFKECAVVEKMITEAIAAMEFCDEEATTWAAAQQIGSIIEDVYGSESTVLTML